MRRTFFAIMMGVAMAAQNNSMAQTNGARFRLMTLDPGHFHASLVQKSMYPDVDLVVNVYAPDGEDLNEHLKRIANFNGIDIWPGKSKHWVEVLHTEPDFFERMLTERPGNIVVLAGKNVKKTDYILRSVQAGLNVLADKPMVVRPEDLPKLQAAFAAAASNHVLLYDIMTERFEITTLLQREFMQQPALFGELEKGTALNPAISYDSIHYISKTVAGSPLKRPAWFFDTSQTGEGITDVSTHLVDLAQFEAFPDTVLSPDNVTVVDAKRWNTKVTREQFQKVTGEAEFPAFLQPYINGGVLEYHCNAAFTWKLRGIYTKVWLVWSFEPPPGGSRDRLHSLMRGTRATLEIRQGALEDYKPELFIKKVAGVDEPQFEAALADALKDAQAKYPGIELERRGEEWRVVVPDKYDVGHEAHFARVTENYLKYLREGKLPDWEVPGMLTKYATIMRAYEMSR
jgi:predicted dehydrogenase